MKPAVDRLEEELSGKVIFIRINIQEEVGRELAPAFGFEYTPTFIFFDEQGVEQWRTIGEFDETRLREEASKR